MFKASSSLKVGVQHWQSGVTKSIVLYPSITYTIFVTQAHEDFVEEIDDNKISIYTLPRRKLVDIDEEVGFTGRVFSTGV